MGGDVSDPELIHRIRPAAGDPHGALVLMHGRGAGEHDLEPLLDELDPERRLVGVLPRGPLSLPPGGAHWYVVPRVGFPTRRRSTTATGVWASSLTPCPSGSGRRPTES
jgi:predicted esterase